MTEQQALRKPKLLYFQWDHRPNLGLSEYLVLQTSDQVRCLQVYFDVTVINHDCDFAEVCENNEPDMVLFEAGYQTYVSRRPNITNLSANRSLPRAGFHNADLWSNCRAGFLSDMEHFGIETYFSLCTTTAEYFPELDGSLYIWPNFIDPLIFRDYGLEKTVPVMLSGQRHEQYPWRQKAYPIVARHFPTLDCPQFEHGSGLAHRSLAGAEYARAINASRISLTCGTMAREVVRKHLEIPGSRTCLVAEEFEKLKAAGFRHMESCIFAEPGEVVDVIDELLRNEDLLSKVTLEGHRLVHERHTIFDRPQVYEWFTLQSQLPERQPIVQDGPFGHLRAASGGVSYGKTPMPTAALDQIQLRAGDSRLWQGDTVRARKHYLEMLRYVPYSPEARFGIALCDLLERDVEFGGRRARETD